MHLRADRMVAQVIRKSGKKWIVLSADGTKKLGTYGSEAEAKKRLEQVEYFKSRKGKK